MVKKNVKFINDVVHLQSKFLDLIGTFPIRIKIFIYDFTMGRTVLFFVVVVVVVVVVFVVVAHFIVPFIF